MSITELSVKRPAAILVALALLLGLGWIGYSSMGADLMPSVNVPVITISTSYAGAGAEEIKKDIVKPVEDAVSGIGGIDQMHSTAREGFGITVITFTMETDMNTALMDVQKAVENVTGKLPKDADKPVLYKVDLNQQAVLTLSVTGTAAYDELYNQADKIKQQIEKMPGIGRVTLQGARKKELYIKLDKTAIEYYGVNINGLLSKLRSENMNMPAGQIKQETTNQSVKVVGEFENLNEVKNLLIPIAGGGTIRLAEIADIGMQYPEDEQILKLNGNNAIGISIQKQSDANVVDAVNGVKNNIDAIKKGLPKGVELTIADDETTFIHSALGEIKRNLVEGIITTAIVLLLFLRKWRSSLIVLIAIPASLIATGFMMYMFNFTLNMLSLMGLSLCIGILVDDSIVVLENIQRHLEMGKTPFQAAIEGRKEIGMAAIAITLCDVVVFTPVAFMSGMTGQFFREFGLTVTFATLFSLLVSFTITPMLSSRILKGEKRKRVDELSAQAKKKPGKFQKVFDKATEVYKSFLIWSLNNRWKVISLVVVGVILSIALIPLKFIGTEFMTQTDQSRVMIDISLTPGSSLKMTDEKVSLIEKHLKGIEEVKEYFTTVGSSEDKSTASIVVKLKDKAQRKKSQSQIAKEIRNWGKTLPGIDFNVSEAQSGGGPGGNKPVQVNVSGPEPEVLKQLAYKVEDIVKSVPGITDVSNSVRTSESEIKVKVDRLAAAEYGISINDISSVLRTGVQGSTVGVFRQGGNEHDIVVKFMDNQVKTTSDIGAIKILNAAGQQIDLNQIATVVQEDSQQKISRQDREDVAKISANIQSGNLGIVNEQIRSKLSSALSVPYGYKIDYGSTQKQMADAFSALIKALAASILLVYMILVVLYESFLTPFIRMLSLPCAIIGALGMLALTGNTLNLMSMIGLIMLDGLASKNGTLLIDYTNTLMKKGVPLKEALVEAGTTRLRPIIMTSVTMIVGMLPSALSLGEGSEMKSGMAIVIIGGMITSTMLSPVLLPVVYTLMDDMKKFIARFKERKKAINFSEVGQYEA